MTTETAIDAVHVVADRIVFTYQPDGIPAGLITGYIDSQVRFVVEHVVALKPGVLLAMLRAGIAEAQATGCLAVVFGIPDEQDTARGLGLAARRVGCQPYTHADGVTFYERVL